MIDFLLFLDGELPAPDASSEERETWLLATLGRPPTGNERRGLDGALAYKRLARLATLARDRDAVMAWAQWRRERGWPELVRPDPVTAVWACRQASQAVELRTRYRAERRLADAIIRQRERERKSEINTLPVVASAFGSPEPPARRAPGAQ